MKASEEQLARGRTFDETMAHNFCRLPRARRCSRRLRSRPRRAQDTLKIGSAIETGRIVGEGAAAALKDDPAVRRAYLGVGDVNS